jgi:hypothetical protein
MAEIPDSSSAAADREYLRRRIEEYSKSAKAGQHFQEGFYGSTTSHLTLEQFKKREEQWRVNPFRSPKVSDEKLLSRLQAGPKVAIVSQWSCFYCGADFENEASLLDHEDDCAEA